MQDQWGAYGEAQMHTQLLPMYICRYLFDAQKSYTLLSKGRMWSTVHSYTVANNALLSGFVPDSEKTHAPA